MKRGAFAYPSGQIYLDGNSLGLMPKAARARVLTRLEEWEHEAVSGWEHWFALSESLSPSIARLVGARPAEVIATGSITVNLHALLATFYRPDGAKRHLVATELDFPSDLYALRSWADRAGAELRLIPSRDGRTLLEEDVLSALKDDVALALLPTVLYRSGQLLPVRSITRAARERGVVIGWDAAHSVGCLPHAFHEDNVDFAVWCHYKYVNAGPGAPGGLFVHERHAGLVPGLAGWWGHDKRTQFEMRPHFHPAEGAGAYQIATPSILALSALEGALETFDELGIDAIRARSLELTAYLIERCARELPEFILVTPREPAQRGGHVALVHPEARMLSLALRERGIVPDFREPDILRLAPVALYNSEDELDQTVRVLRELLDSGQYRHFAGQASAVT
ncbi:kynureninase [Deinococcus peraridilitoris]|uniref:Kynureninase n=1 Tax=Deinococcus peraridilitoris (strain DSM 19664 / LMG 22246 / CIP 109416 / KR-200) TaxID=937777 RepID=K9ZW43_DEIPD|nr:kynureninase [Deinococcus peraridilitoris]AFZ65786.1 kynureninase [Deinococcus peraridilitoris DSM 19664]